VAYFYANSVAFAGLVIVTTFIPKEQVPCFITGVLNH